MAVLILLGNAALLAAVMGGAMPASEQGPLAGTWEGFWFRAGDSLRVTLIVQRDTTGQYSATFTSDRLRVSGIPFNEVQLQG